MPLLYKMHLCFLSCNLIQNLTILSTLESIFDIFTFCTLMWTCLYFILIRLQVFFYYNYFIIDMMWTCVWVWVWRTKNNANIPKTHGTKKNLSHRTSKCDIFLVVTEKHSHQVPCQTLDQTKEKKFTSGNTPLRAMGLFFIQFLSEKQAYNI